MTLFKRSKVSSSFMTITAWILLILWLALIFVLSSVQRFPVDLSRTEYGIISNIIHLLLYAVLCWFFTRAFYYSRVPLKKALFYAFILTLLYGASDELHQNFVAGREMRLDDWLIDAVGALVVLFFYNYKIQLRISKK
ncbi:MAG: VanZ family protein [Patescibacteria group bacterium]